MKSPKDWPAANVEMRAIAGLVPYARNARTHSPEQVDQIAASMREFGWTNPVLIDEEGTLIAGHGRILAAQKLGLTEAPVMTARGWTEAQRRAYVLADNKLALNAGWDMERLAVELSDLSGMGFDLGLTGFSIDELSAMATDAAGGHGGGAGGSGPASSLAERFGVPPFSVLRAAEGWWQDRKRAWLALGIQSEVGRGENLLKFSDTINEPDPAKRKAKNGKRKAATFGQDLKRGAGLKGIGQVRPAALTA
jgi:ParB-like chromosome segregation protein Spo0J